MSVDSGDVMILMGHRVRGDVDRRALIAHVDEAGSDEHMLVVRFDESDRAIDDLATPVVPLSAYRIEWPWPAFIVITTVLLGLLLTTAWPQ